MKIEERCFKDWLMEQYKVLTTGREKTISGEWERGVTKKEKQEKVLMQNPNNSSLPLDELCQMLLLG